MFYLAGGVFAGLGYVWATTHALVGASGAIAAVTTAYLALFPRSRVTILYWWFFIGTFELPSLILIIFKMILWDNVLAPEASGAATSRSAPPGRLRLRICERLCHAGAAC